MSSLEETLAPTAGRGVSVCDMFSTWLGTEREAARKGRKREGRKEGGGSYLCRVGEGERQATADVPKRDTPTNLWRVIPFIRNVQDGRAHGDRAEWSPRAGGSAVTAKGFCGVTEAL